MGMNMQDLFERVIRDGLIDSETRIKIAVKDADGNFDWEESLLDVQEVKVNPYADEVCFVIEKKN
jgi:hypothetical protein